MRKRGEGVLQLTGPSNAAIKSVTRVDGWSPSELPKQDPTCSPSTWPSSKKTIHDQMGQATVISRSASCGLTKHIPDSFVDTPRLACFCSAVQSITAHATPDWAQRPYMRNVPSYLGFLLIRSLLLQWPLLSFAEVAAVSRVGSLTEALRLWWRLQSMLRFLSSFPPYCSHLLLRRKFWIRWIHHCSSSLTARCLLHHSHLFSHAAILPTVVAALLHCLFRIQKQRHFSW